MPANGGPYIGHRAIRFSIPSKPGDPALASPPISLVTQGSDRIQPTGPQRRHIAGE